MENGSVSNLNTLQQKKEEYEKKRKELENIIFEIDKKEKPTDSDINTFLKISKEKEEIEKNIKKLIHTNQPKQKQNREKVEIFIDYFDGEKKYENVYAFGDGIDDIFDILQLPKGNMLSESWIQNYSDIKNGKKKAFKSENIDKTHGLLVFRNHLSTTDAENEIPIEFREHLISQSKIDKPLTIVTNISTSKGKMIQKHGIFINTSPSASWDIIKSDLQFINKQSETDFEHCLKQSNSIGNTRNHFQKLAKTLVTCIKKEKMNLKPLK